jgi:hypothetical protein
VDALEPGSPEWWQTIDRMTPKEASTWLLLSQNPTVPAEDRKIAAHIFVSWHGNWEAKRELARLQRRERWRRRLMPWRR